MPIPTMALPLSSKQKGILSRLAKEAWQRASDLDLTDLSPEDWRANEAVTACSRRISQARNGDFLVLQAHFLNLAGKAGEAFKSAMRHHDEAKRQAIHKLTSELGKAGLDQSYAESICLDTYKCAISQATPEQTWQLMYTVRNRRKTNRKQS